MKTKTKTNITVKLVLYYTRIADTENHLVIRCTPETVSHHRERVKRFIDRFSGKFASYRFLETWFQPVYQHPYDPERKRIKIHIKDVTEK